MIRNQKVLYLLMTRLLNHKLLNLCWKMLKSQKQSTQKLLPQQLLVQQELKLMKQKRHQKCL